jgi:hypothetical protein
MEDRKIHHSQDTAIETAVRYMREAMTDENTEMCLVIANTETGAMRIIGLNMPEEEVPLLLTAAAEEMAEAIMEQYDNRTVN